MSMTKEQAQIVIEIIQQSIQYYRDSDLHCMDMARAAQEVRDLEQKLLDNCVSETFDSQLTRAALHSVQLGGRR